MLFSLQVFIRIIKKQIGAASHHEEMLNRYFYENVEMEEKRS